MVDYAEITGTALVPGTEDPMWVEITARPLVEGYGLVIDEDTTLKGPVVALSNDETGEYSISIPIVEDVVWRFRMRAVAGADTTVWHMGDFPVTESSTIGGLGAATIPTAVTDDFAETIFTARDQVATDRAAVEAIGTTTDAIIAGRIEDDASETYGALTATIAAYLASQEPAARATITIPAGKVSSALTAFPVKVNLAELGDSFWDHIADDGSDLRVRDGATDLPFDLVRIDAANRTGEVFFRADVPTTEKSFTIGKIGGATPPAPTDPLGRNAVWDDFDAVYVGGDGVERSGAGIRTPGVAGAPYFKATRVSPDLKVHQGICYDPKGAWFAIDTNGTGSAIGIVKYDLNFVEMTRNPDPIAAAAISANHMGAGCVIGNELFVPIQTYPTATYDNQWIAVYDTATLAFIRKHDISARATDPTGLCYDGTYLCAPSYAHDSKIERFTFTQGSSGTLTYNNTVTPATTIPSRQGIEWADGYFWLTSQTGDLIVRMNADGSSVRNVEAGMSASRDGGFVEGITKGPDGHLYVTWADSASAGSRLWRYEARAERLQYDGVNWDTLAAVPKRTSWTLGVSYRPWKIWAVGQPRSILSYGASDGSGNSHRVTLAQDTTGKYSTWNSTNSWLDGTTVPTLGQRVRLHHLQNGTTARSLFVNGAQENTGATAARPSLLGDRLWVGVGDGISPAQQAAGAMDYLYLRNGLMSAAWLAAEYANWESSGFYTVDA